MNVQCWVCLDKGFVIYKETINKLTYDYVAYCDRCEEGSKQRYDERDNEVPIIGRTYYCTPKISEVAIVNKIIAYNKSKYGGTSQKVEQEAVDDGKTGVPEWEDDMEIVFGENDT